jgi:hypothetical protein
MNPATGFVPVGFDPLGGLFLGAATDLADHDDAVWFPDRSLNSLMTSRCEVPLTGSPPMPTQVDWPTPRRGELPHGFVGQACRTRQTTPMLPFL